MTATERINSVIQTLNAETPTREQHGEHPDDCPRCEMIAHLLKSGEIQRNVANLTIDAMLTALQRGDMSKSVFSGIVFGFFVGRAFAESEALERMGD